MPKLKLASQGLNTGGDPGGLSPVQFNGDIAGRIRNPAINVHAGDVSFTPLTAPRYVEDQSLGAMAGLSQVWVDAAFKHQQNIQQAKADQLVLNAERDIGAALYGTEDQEGYLASEGQVAVDSHPTATKRINSLIKGYINSAEPGVQAKAILRLQTIRDNAGLKMASHKSQQNKQWQKDIAAAKEASVFRDLYSKAGDPVAFSGEVAGHILAMDETYKGRPDIAEVEQFAFVTKAYSGVVDTLTKAGRFGEAGNYINMGVSQGADQQVMATRLSQLEGAMHSANARKESAAATAAAAAKREADMVANILTQQAIEKNDPSLLNMIPDLPRRGKFQNLFSQARKGVVSDPQAEAAVASAYNEISRYPDILLDENFAPGLSAERRLLLHDKFMKEGDSGDAQLLRDAEDWAKAVIPPIFDSMQGKFRNEAAQSTLTKVNKIMRNAVEDARANNQDPSIAIMEAQNKILTDPSFQDNFGEVQVGREDLLDIPYLKDTSMLHLAKSMSGVPTEDQARIRTSFGQNASKIMQQYGATTVNGKLDREALMLKLQNNPQKRKQFMRDLNMLYMQKRYLDQLIETSSVSSDAVAKATGGAKNAK